MGNIREREHERLLTLGNELGMVEREVGGGGSDWVTSTEMGAWQDCLLYTSDAADDVSWV